MADKRSKAVCEQLLLLLNTAEARDAGETMALTIAAHVAGCPVCVADERALTRLITRYLQTEQPSIPDALEQRLLDRLCGVHENHS